MSDRFGEVLHRILARIAIGKRCPDPRFLMSRDLLVIVEGLEAPEISLPAQAIEPDLLGSRIALRFTEAHVINVVSQLVEDRKKPIFLSRIDEGLAIKTNISVPEHAFLG